MTNEETNCEEIRTKIEEYIKQLYNQVYGLEYDVRHERNFKQTLINDLQIFSQGILSDTERETNSFRKILVNGDNIHIEICAKPYVEKLFQSATSNVIQQHLIKAKHEEFNPVLSINFYIIALTNIALTNVFEAETSRTEEQYKKTNTKTNGFDIESLFDK